LRERLDPVAPFNSCETAHIGGVIVESIGHDAEPGTGVASVLATVETGPRSRSPWPNLE
jgi:hypothetical protein